MKQTKNARDEFILEKQKQGFNAYEIKLLLVKNNFNKISAARIYQILEENGIKVGGGKAEKKDIPVKN